MRSRIRIRELRQDHGVDVRWVLDSFVFAARVGGHCLPKESTQLIRKAAMTTYSMERQEYIEHTELQPIDPQTNGPQLLYGLRYHTHIVKPGEVETYHDQVGYWLWEPATGDLIQTVAIPRGQTVLAFGRGGKEDTSFELLATRGTTTTNGILSNSF